MVFKVVFFVILGILIFHFTFYSILDYFKQRQEEKNLMNSFDASAKSKVIDEFRH